MRILHLIDHWGLGGAQRVVATLTRLETDHHHHIAAVFQHGQHPWSTPITPFFLADSYIGLPNAVGQLRHLLQRINPDLVHVHLYGARFVVQMALIALKPKPIVVWHEHSEGEIFERFPKPLAKALLFWQTRLAIKKVILASPTTSGLQFIKHTYKLPQHRLHLLPNPVDCEAIRAAASKAKPIERPSDAPVVAFIGRLVTQKGAETVLPLFRRFLEKAPGAQLWIVGDGPLRTSMEKQAAQHHLQQQITFFGIRSDVEAILHAVDLVIMPSVYEPFGMVAAEAFSLNKSVVGNAVDGLGELLHNHPLGHAVASNDRSAFVEAMVSAIHQSEIPTSLAIPEWDASLAIPKWRQFYTDLEEPKT